MQTIKAHIETDEQYKDRVLQNQIVDIENLNEYIETIEKRNDNYSKVIARISTENQQLREVLQQCQSLIGNSYSAIDTVNPTELKTVWVVLYELLNSGKEK